MGAVKPPPGLAYKALEVGMVPPRRDGIDRHGRMLRALEFDAAEVSLASYVIARGRGVPVIGIPVFPRRLFCQNHIYVNKSAGIRNPADLAGKRVGLWAFQVTMSVLAKGDLKDFYGVPWEKIGWHTQHPEEMPWSHPEVRLQAAPAGRDLAQMLLDGEIDAYIHPHPPAMLQNRTDRIARLFEDAPAECIRYYRARRFYPIMHLLAVKEERLRERPQLARELMQLWEESKTQAHDFYHDPGYAILAFARTEYEHQTDALGPDPWTSGLRANRPNLERFIGWMVDQRLLERAVPVDALFHPTVLDT